VPSPYYRFGDYLVDRASYRVLRGDAVVEVTPKLLDLLLHLVDRAGALVTKEELLDTLWPDANVTENALAQAMSELRQALGDDAGAPQFIKTIARRGYRFIAPVERLDSLATASAAPAGPAADAHDRAVAVLDFTNVTGESDSAWLSAGIAETVTGDLRGLGVFHVIDRWRVAEAVRRGGGSLRAIASDLHVSLVVLGSYQRNGDQIRITARIVNADSGEAVGDAKVDGPAERIFDLQDRVVARLAEELGLSSPAGARRAGPRETPSLEAYRASIEGWLQLETLDIRRTRDAIANFERAIAADRRYAMAYTGLASAQLIEYESTRSDNRPAADLLERAIADARQAVSLDDTLAEAHAALALVLVSAWQQPEAIVAARRAVTLEPNNWRHFFRLGHASWGDARLQAATTTLSLYPDFAFAHFQVAMLHVARGRLADAETVLRHGAAVQDRQIGRGERYPPLGLHWLLGLVRLAQEDVEEALEELAREQELAAPHRLYGREYAMNAHLATGACLLRLARPVDAAESFRRALALYPDHAQSHLGLALALRASGLPAAAKTEHITVQAALDTLTRTRPVEAAIVAAHVAASEGDRGLAVAGLLSVLETAPPGFAAWTLPVEPLLSQVVGTRDLVPVLARLAERAR
jgi:DNA-binding winged helix-turn-helix (wHTH) protein